MKINHLQDDSITKEVTQTQRGLFGPIHQSGNPTIELPNDENELFDEEDDVGTTIISDLSSPSVDEEEEAKPSSVWEYDINDLVQLCPLHAEGKDLQKCVRHQQMEYIEQVF